MKEGRTRKWVKVIKIAKRTVFLRHSKILGVFCVFVVVPPLSKHVLVSTLRQKRAAERKTQRDHRLAGKELYELGEEETNAQGRKIIPGKKMKGHVFCLK